MSIAVNDVAISDQVIDQEVQYHPASTLEEAQHLASRALVVREVLLQEARHLGIVADESAGTSAGTKETEEEALISQLIAREVKIPRADEQICRRYFETHPEKFRSPDIFEVSHILFAAAADDTDARAAASERCTSALGLLIGGVGRFTELATELSDCPSKHAGGNLGQVSRGQTVPEFEAALCHMTPGKLHPQTVESRYGFHIVHLHRRIDGASQEYAMVCDRIANYLTESVRRRAINQYLQILIGKAEITGIELQSSDSPLLQ